MRGVDTNILLRSLTGDDPRQSPVANRFLAASEAAGERLFVSTIVLCELAWTLRGKPYSYDRPRIAAAIERLLAVGLFVIQDRDLVREALAEYPAGRVDFPDLLLGMQAFRAGCEATVTLDRNLAGRREFEVLR